MDSTHYPQGSGALKSRYVAGVLEFYDSAGVVLWSINPVTGAIIYTKVITANGGVTGNVTGDITGAIDAATLNGITVGDSILHSKRQRVTLTQLNAGQIILAAVAGFKYRLVDWNIIAIGGAYTTGTGVLLEGNQSGVVNLVAVAAAQLTQSAINTPSTTNTVLADGASFVANDANTTIALNNNGTDATVLTNVDVIVTYTVEA